MRTTDALLTYAEEDITVGASAVRLTEGNVLTAPPPRQADLFVEDAQIRYRLDGTDPSSTVGEILNPFDRLTLTHPSDMYKFRAIRTGSVSATLRARYLR